MSVFVSCRLLFNTLLESFRDVYTRLVSDTTQYPEDVGNLFLLIVFFSRFKTLVTILACHDAGEFTNLFREYKPCLWVQRNISRRMSWSNRLRLLVLLWWSCLSCFVCKDTILFLYCLISSLSFFGQCFNLSFVQCFNLSFVQCCKRDCVQSWMCWDQLTRLSLVCCVSSHIVTALC